MGAVGNFKPHLERFDLLLTVIDSLKRTRLHFQEAATGNRLREGDATAVDLITGAWLAVLEDDRILVEFKESAQSPEGNPIFHWVTTEVLKRVSSLVNELDHAVTVNQGTPFVSHHVRLLAEELASVISTGKGYEQPGERGENHLRQLDHASDMLRQFDSGIFVRTSEKDAIKVLERTKDIQKAASAAVGSTGDNVMAQHYQELADKESETARRFRLWTMVSTVFGGVAAAFFVLGPTLGWAVANIESGDWVHMVQRAIVTAAIFAFSAYLARQAHQHRAMANWAGSLAVQLKTFEAFLAPITSEDVRDRLRTSFATRVFGEHPVLKGEPSGTGTADMAEKALDILAKNSAK